MPGTRTITRLLIVAMLFSIFGCASIVSGGPKSLPIMSTPDGAELYPDTTEGRAELRKDEDVRIAAAKASEAADEAAAGQYPR